MIALQKEAKQKLESGDIIALFDVVSKEVGVAKELRMKLLHDPVVETDDPDVKQLLAGINLTELEDFDKAGCALLFSWITPAEYGARYAEVNVLVTAFRVPYNLRCFLDEARQCYALGQFAAVQSLSRTILEAAVNDIAVRTGMILEAKIEKISAKARIEKVAPHESKRVYDHYKDLCVVVHGRSTTTSKGALGSLTKTMGFVHHLYENHKATIRNHASRPKVSSP